MLVSQFGIDELRRIAVRRIRDRVKTSVKAVIDTNVSEDSL